LRGVIGRTGPDLRRAARYCGESSEGRSSTARPLLAHGTVGYGLVPEVLSSSLLIAIPAQAAPATVYIYKVYFDSPGSDRGSNPGLNAEYVVIRNGDCGLVARAEG
jgi:hypothetical protein